LSYTYIAYTKLSTVVATTRRNSTRDMLTSAKLSNGLSSSGVYKRTRQGALAVLLLYLYNLQVVRATTILTDPKVHASTSCPITHPCYGTLNTNNFLFYFLLFFLILLFFFFILFFLERR